MQKYLEEQKIFNNKERKEEEKGFKEIFSNSIPSLI